MKKSYSVFTDGGARGNPGPAAIGVVIVDADENIVSRIGKVIGSTTNNVAEYTAVIEALNWLINNLSNSEENLQINFYSDSELIVNQINGKYKVKDAKLITLCSHVKILLNQLKVEYQFKSIRREKNSLADSLVNQSLDMK